MGPSFQPLITGKCSVLELPGRNEMAGPATGQLNTSLHMCEKRWLWRM